VIRLQLGVGVREGVKLCVGVGVRDGVRVRVDVGVGVKVGLGVSVDVGVSVIVGVSVGVGVSEGVGVSVIVGVSVGVGVQVSWANVAWAMTRETRNFSTIVSRLAVRGRYGHQLLSIGAMSGWWKSTVTETWSPGPPPSSEGAQSAGRALLTSEGVYVKPSLFEHTVTWKNPGCPAGRVSFRSTDSEPARAAS